jgi:enoyl-CoA hydratase/carnithine racemase
VAKGFRLPEELVRRLAQVVGPMRAAEIAYAGAVHSADEGRAAGFVTRVLPHGDDPAEAARALAASLAARPPHSIATVALPLRELNRPEE